MFIEKILLCIRLFEINRVLVVCDVITGYISIVNKVHRKYVNVEYYFQSKITPKNIRHTPAGRAYKLF